jgi:dipeptidyl aminopeptidase/acylaminoacyl peptidase
MHQKLLGLLGSVAVGSFFPLAETEVLASHEPHLARQPSIPMGSDEQPVPLIDRQRFFQDPAIADAQLSPDGQYLAFLKSSNGAMNLWVKRLTDAMDQAIPLTWQSHHPISSYVWSADSQYLIYGQDQAGDENFQLYRLTPEEALSKPEVPPAVLALTPYPDIQARIYGVPKTTPQTMIVGLNDRDPRFHDVYRLNLTTGERTLLSRGEPGILDWTVDHAGKLRLATRQTAQGATEILTYHQGQFQSVYSCSLLETCTPVGFHPDNNQVYLSTNRGDEVDLTQLTLLDLSTQQTTVISRDPSGKVDLGGTIFSSATQALLGVIYQDNRLRVEPLDPAFAANWAFLKQQFPQQDIYKSSLTQDDHLALIRVQSDVNPGTVYLFNQQCQSLEKLYDARPNLNPHWLAPMHPLSYTARDGLEIPAYLTLPKGVPARHLPTVIMPHGGPWGRDTWGYNAYVQFLANRGYAVLQPNFRGSAGYGQAFLNAGNQTWGTGAMQHDLTDGVRYLIEQGIAAPDRIGIFGSSYGGYAALAGLTFTPKLYAAGVSLAGPTNLLTLLAAIPPYWASLRSLFAIRLGDLDNPDDYRRLAEQSPLFAIANIQAPLLIIQGAQDPRVPQREADQLVAALRDAGKPVSYLLAPDEGHGFRKQENLLAAMTALEEFLATHLGGRFQPSVSPTIQRQLEQMTVEIETVTWQIP